MGSTGQRPVVARLSAEVRAEILERLAEDRAAYAGNPEIQTMSRRVLGWMAVAEALLADLAEADEARDTWRKAADAALVMMTADRDTWRRRWVDRLVAWHEMFHRPSPMTRCTEDCGKAAALLRPEGTG